METPRAKTAYGIYVHIPFCASKCPYCDFVSGVVSESRKKKYLTALQNEIIASPFSGSLAETLYLGGGTPSELRSGELKTLIGTLTQTFSFSPGAEWTIECNPGSTVSSFLREAKLLGFNRISLGVQSFSSHQLERLGRGHKAEDSLSAYAAARDTGFELINLDLIFGIPGQTLDEWRDDLQGALRLGPEHLSLYSLSIESGTEFGDLMRAGLLSPLRSDLSADMFELALDLTAREGYLQYEISNYSRERCECRHNLRYWRNEAYLGFGLGAASFDQGVRWVNTSDWARYESSSKNGAVERASQEKLNVRKALAEEVMLRLRTRWGFSPRILSKKYACDFWATLGAPAKLFQADGLLEISDDQVRLTRKGILLADEVCATFLQLDPVS